MQGHLPLEAEHLVGAEEPRLQRVVRGCDRCPLEDRGCREVPAQAARPQHVHPAAGQRRDTDGQQAHQLVGVERDLVGHPQLGQPVEHRPRLGRGAQRDRRVGASPVPEPVTGTVARPGAGLGPEHRRVAQVQWVLLVVDLEHEPDRPGHELLLVGLHAQRDPDQLRQVGGVGSRLQPAGQPLVERPGRRGATPSGRCRGRARHRVGDGVEHRPDDPLVVRAVPGQGPHPVLVLGVERRDPPVVVGRLESARCDQAQAQQRRTGQQPHAGVQVVARVRLGQHRQRRPDGERHGAPVVGELDDALARWVTDAQQRRPGHRHEPHSADSSPRRRQALRIRGSGDLRDLGTLAQHRGLTTPRLSG